MRKLAIYLKQYKIESVFAPLFKMLEAFFDLLVPIVVADILNNGVGTGNNSRIIRGFLILIALAAMGLASSITAQFFAAKASVGFATNLRQALFDHVQSFSYSELDKIGTDTLMTRMTSDINQVQNGLNMALRLLLRSPFIVFGSMIMAFTIDFKSALVFAVAIPILSVVVYGIMMASIPLFGKAQVCLDKVLGVTRENLTGVRVIRAFCKEEEEVKSFDEKNEALTKMDLFVGRLSALMNPATYVLINIATIVLIKADAIQVGSGAIRQGDVVALYNYMAQMIVELVKLASLIITINKAVACAKRVETVMEIKPGMTYPAAGTAAGAATGSGYSGKTTEAADTSTGEGSDDAVVFRNVSFTYDGGGAPSLDDVSFAIKRGETVGITGGTGSGKTSLVNLIARFYDATSGAVEVDGRNVRDYAEGELIESIGIVPQKATLFKGTIRDNLRWGNENASDEEIMNALTTARALDVVNGKKGGLDFMLEQNGRNLSGGQRQRLTIARALVRHPEILIMDDSTSALDFATDAALRKAIRSLPGDMTVFIVSQRTASIMNADTIIVLDDGKVVGQGRHSGLMKNCGVYREIYYSQFPEKRAEEALI